MFQQKRNSKIFPEDVSVEEIINYIINYKDDKNNLLINTFNINYLIAYLDRSKIDKIQKLYNNYPEGLDIVQFVRFFLNAITHKQTETLFLSIAIIDLFKEISSLNHSNKYLKFIDITNYMCNKVLQQKGGQYSIKTKLLPHQRNIEPVTKIRQIQINAPIIYGTTEQCILKLVQGKLKTDRTKHYGTIKNAYFIDKFKQIFSLDSLSDWIGVYDINCTLLKRISPLMSKIKKDVIILAFAYSQRQERLGAVLKDYSMMFWDALDNFQYEKIFSTTAFCSEYQSNIWFLQHHNQWVTGDRSGMVFVWDLNKQIPTNKISLKLRSKINDLCELPCLNLIAVVQQNRILDATTKKEIQYQSKISIYNLNKGILVSQIDMANRGVHTLCFSNTYQVLLTAGFQNKIKIFQINPYYFDSTLKGNLIGHESLITTFIPIQNTPMIISADDKGQIKVWDIRNYKCLQTLDFGDKIIISKLLNLIDIGKFAFLGTRINLIQFDQKSEIKKKKKKKQFYPLKAEFQPSTEEIIIFTKTDLRVYQIRTGKIKYIYSGFFQFDQQITTCKYLSSLKRFILGNNKGEIKVYSLLTGQIISEINGHSAQILGIWYDVKNKLYITSSWDSNIFIHKEQTKGFIKIRQMRDNFHKKEITLLQISVYHNLIVIGSSSQNIVYFWDYQFGKLLSGITFGNSEPTSICFINGYSMILIGDSNGHIKCYKFYRKQLELKIKLQFVFTIDNDELKEGGGITHMLLDVRLTEGIKNENSVQKCMLIVGVTKGIIYEIDLLEFIKNKQFYEHASTRQNYNAERQLKQNFINEINKQKFLLFQQKEQNIKKLEQIIEMDNIIKFKAHKQNLTNLSFMQYKQKYYITCSIDKRMKIWKKGGILIGDNNINLPLPYKWDIFIQDSEKNKQRIMIAIKIIQQIFKRYGNDLSIGESISLRIDKLFRQSKNNCFMTEINHKSSQKKIEVKTFQEQFNKRDLHYDKIKQYYFSQIGGISLKQMQVQKRINLIHKTWKYNAKKDEQEREKMLQQIHIKAAKAQQREQIIQFLDPSKTPELVNNKINKSEFELKLGKQLDASLNKKDNKQINKTIRFSKRITRMHPKQSEKFKSLKNKNNQNKNIMTFQNYFAKLDRQKFQTQHSDSKLLVKSRRKQFHQILNKMNSRITQCKKYNAIHFLKHSSENLQQKCYSSLVLKTKQSLSNLNRNKVQFS